MRSAIALGDEWTVVGQIADEAAARGRLQHAVADPEWRLLDNNCEHVTWLVATGQKNSLPVAGAPLVVGCVGLLFLFRGDGFEKKGAVGSRSSITARPGGRGSPVR